jgi:hypothetical protein
MAEYTFDDLIEAYPEVPATDVLRWVFNQPSLREQLLADAKDLIVKHEHAKLGNRARNKKLTAAEKSILARHAALSRHGKNLRLTLEQVMLRSNGAVNGAVAGGGL